MLRLSKKADYALIAMKHLALREGRGSSSAREIAEQYSIPVELMAKVLQRRPPGRALEDPRANSPGPVPLQLVRDGRGQLPGRGAAARFNRRRPAAAPLTD